MIGGLFHLRQRSGVNDNRQKRRDAERWGRRAETLAIWRLRLKGYRILARRVRSPVGEIDVVATRGRLVAFIEVKLRRTREEALSAVTHNQQRRVVRAAEAFVAARPHLMDLDQRFDVIFVPKGRLSPGLPHHIPDAWRP